MRIQPVIARAVSGAASRVDGQKAVCADTHADHSVQFYESEGFLATAVADFLAIGLADEQLAIVIATQQHRAAFSAHMRSQGFDVDSACRRGQLTWLDARETLSAVMADSAPDRARFRATIGRAIEKSMRGDCRHATVRVYGEMVDLLRGDGNTDGAIRLEDLWNELADTHSFSLLCAYAMDNFRQEADAHAFQAICQRHGRVIPTERYTAHFREDANAREISMLQQRARALESEIEHRKTLERRLRGALAEQQRVEQALRRSEADLERAAAERERLLEREREARTLAEAASSAKSEFLAVMSHELRTPLNAIAGHMQLIELGVHGPVTDAQHDALSRAQRSQRYLLSLINDVLNLVRVEAGHVEYTLEELPLAPLLGELASVIEPLLSTKRLSYEMPASDAPASLAVRADREKVWQILLNLLTNAIKFTPAGGRIAVEVAAPCPEMPSMACVRVRDTGIGIPAAKIAGIFEPFVQLGMQSLAAHHGVGLGLAISRDLARGMGGDLSVESVVGEGTTFTLALPRV